MTTATFNPVQTRVKMITSWTPEQFQKIRKAIFKHFRGREITCTSGRTEKHTFANYTALDAAFGLAYTSSGMFACYGVCNCQPLFDADGIYSYSYFTIGTDGNCYALVQDNEENELCIEL